MISKFLSLGIGMGVGGLGVGGLGVTALGVEVGVYLLLVSLGVLAGFVGFVDVWLVGKSRDLTGLGLPSKHLVFIIFISNCSKRTCCCRPTT